MESEKLRLKANIRKEIICVMFGIELRRLRDANCLSQRQLAEKMDAWGWSRRTVDRFENGFEFRLCQQTMADLLKVLNASSI
jgi:transcriptional regulator with XRE-family HTH domain